MTTSYEADLTYTYPGWSSSRVEDYLRAKNPDIPDGELIQIGDGVVKRISGEFSATMLMSSEFFVVDSTSEGCSRLEKFIKDRRANGQTVSHSEAIQFMNQFRK